MTATPAADYFLWRKYEMAQPAFLWRGGIQKQTYLWLVDDAGQCESLNRWELLGPAFAGFVSRGVMPAHSTAYWADKVVEVLAREGLFKSWILGADAAELVEYVQSNLMDVWMGDHTPYLVTRGNSLSVELRAALNILR